MNSATAHKTIGKGGRQILLFLLVGIFYKISRFIAIGNIHTAFQHARQVVNLEKHWGIFEEISVQHAFMHQTSLIFLVNKFYLYVHVPSIALFFYYLFKYHQSYYYYIRNSFLFANFLTLFIFIWFPCAPPRMLPDLGFVDTLFQFSHWNLYKGGLTRFFNQYAAMPSMHFGTALMIGICTAIFAPNRIIKILSLLYAPFVLFVIIVTANHFFIDAIAGACITAVGFVLMAAFYIIFHRQEVQEWLAEKRIQKEAI